MTATADASTEATTRLSDEEAAQVLGILKHVDSVELKLTVPADMQGATIRGLPLDPVEAVPRQVFFFDTPDLALDRAGIVVRARRMAGGRGDTAVKLRPVRPDELARKVRRDARFRVELDALPGGFVCSGSFKERVSGKAVRKAASGDITPSKLFSKDQRNFFAAHAPAGIELDALQMLGPVFVLKASFDADLDRDDSGPARQMVTELWLYPDGSMILEISLKCGPTEAFQVAAELRAWLTARGVSLGPAQQTKTRAALDYFAGLARMQAS
jgi:hypothetical protein